MNDKGHALLFHLMRIFLEREMCRQARAPSLATHLDAIAPDMTSILPSLEALDEVPRVSLEF